MASPHWDYRDSSIKDVSDCVALSGEDSDTNIGAPIRSKKTYRIDSSDEDLMERNSIAQNYTICESSDDDNSFNISEDELSEVCAETDISKERHKDASKLKSDSPCAFSSYDIDECSDVIVSDEDSMQETFYKPRKSVRISLALGKLLSTVDDHKSESVQVDTMQVDKDHNESAMCKEPAKIDLQNDSVVFSSDDSIDNRAESVQVYQEHNESAMQKEPAKIDLQNDSVVFSSDDSIDNRAESVQVYQEHNESAMQKEPAKIDLQNDSVVFSSDDSINSRTESVQVYREHNEKAMQKEPALSKTCSDSVALTSDDTNDQATSDIQVIRIEDKLKKLTVSDIRTYGEVYKPKVTQSYYELKNDIEKLSTEVTKLKNVLRSIDVSKLPDNGMKLQMKLQESSALLKKKEREFKELQQEYGTMKEVKEKEKSTSYKLPAGLGIKALEGQIREKTLTDDALKNLHGSINSCPGENVYADDPSGLKSSVKLMPHQKNALAWLLWRETQQPPVGILADDMGLGKTLTMISLILKTKEEKDEKDNEGESEDDDDYGYPDGGTLVVCPASLLLQWEEEIKKHCKRGILDVEIHHGSNREDSARRLSQSEIVITTYSIVRTSASKGGKDDSVKRSRRGVLHRIRWNRIILDEAHAIRNHKSQQSIAVCQLMGRRRWALTGTPIHNKELDLYALLKFLKCSPFDDYNVWRRWVDNKSIAGTRRLNTLINAIMLRRTKSILQDKDSLYSLPDKSVSEIFVCLDETESEVYTKILWFSKTLFAQFLQQRADKEQLTLPTPVYVKSSHGKNMSSNDNSLANHPELAKMFNKFQGMHDIKTHEILVLLLRLRQICVHPGLIKAMLDKETKETAGLEDADTFDSDVLSKFDKMSLGETSHVPHSGNEDTNVLQINNPVFDPKRMSSKIKAVFDVLEQKVLSTSDKAIIVSQWASVLKIISEHLSSREIKHSMLTGSVAVQDRMPIVSDFNNTNSGSKILLLSLTAGGVGLNLTGANHMFLIDLHWNPQLESQAFDRIYRVGQKKEVYIYKFICQETIEERIQKLQMNKLSLAEGVLSGSVKRNASKLTFDDLKSLFSM